MLCVVLSVLLCIVMYLCRTVMCTVVGRVVPQYIYVGVYVRMCDHTPIAPLPARCNQRKFFTPGRKELQLLFEKISFFSPGLIIVSPTKNAKLFEGRRLMKTEVALMRRADKGPSHRGYRAVSGCSELL